MLPRVGDIVLYTFKPSFNPFGTICLKITEVTQQAVYFEKIGVVPDFMRHQTVFGEHMFSRDIYGTWKLDKEYMALKFIQKWDSVHSK